jgi:hypothetical protein
LLKNVMPAKAGIQKLKRILDALRAQPAFAGMTILSDFGLFQQPAKPAARSMDFWIVGVMACGN